MLTKTDPMRAYRRVERDAAIMGSDPRALTLLCYDEFLTALGSALHAETAGASTLQRQALIRASAALLAIRSGTDAAHPMAGVLTSMVDAAERSLRGTMVRFNAASVQAMRQDFTDIRAALAAAK